MMEWSSLEMKTINLCLIYQPLFPVKVWLRVSCCGPFFPSFRLRGTSPSCRHHAERATVLLRNWPSGGRQAVVLIQHIGRFGLVSMTNAPTFSASRVYPMCTREMAQNAQNDHILSQNVVLVLVRARYPSRGSFFFFRGSVFLFSLFFKYAFFTAVRKSHQ